MTVERMADDRLSRIEAKLDKLTEAFINLARVEERMVTLFRRMDAYEVHQKEIGARVERVEVSVGRNGYAMRFAERIFWLVTAASLAAYFSGAFK